MRRQERRSEFANSSLHMNDIFCSFLAFLRRCPFSPGCVLTRSVMSRYTCTSMNTRTGEQTKGETVPVNAALTPHALVDAAVSPSVGSGAMQSIVFVLPLISVSRRKCLINRGERAYAHAQTKQKAHKTGFGKQVGQMSSVRCVGRTRAISPAHTRENVCKVLAAQPDASRTSAPSPCFRSRK